MGESLDCAVQTNFVVSAVSHNIDFILLLYCRTQNFVAYSYCRAVLFHFVMLVVELQTIMLWILAVLLQSCYYQMGQRGFFLGKQRSQALLRLSKSSIQSQYMSIRRKPQIVRRKKTPKLCIQNPITVPNIENEVVQTAKDRAVEMRKTHCLGKLKEPYTVKNLCFEYRATTCEK